jgi:hypothetical protein
MLKLVCSVVSVLADFVTGQLRNWRNWLSAVGCGPEHQRGVLLERIANGFQIQPSVDLGRAHVGVIESSADQGKTVSLGGEPAPQSPPQVMNPSVRHARSLPKALLNLGGFRQMSTGSLAGENVLRAPRQGFQNLHRGVRKRQQVGPAGFGRGDPPSFLLQVHVAPAC